MSRTKELTLSESWGALKQQREAGRPEPSTVPFMAVSKIKLWPAVFQHRRPSVHASAAHVKELARGAAAESLEPVLVWWDGKRWACIDGHHRLRAYVQAGKSNHAVPVQVFSGTPEQAMAEAARRNTRDKLAMSHGEKLGTAWRLVVATEMSKAGTVDASGASDRTVANMRRVRDKLNAQGVVVAELGWEAARRQAAGEAQEKVDWDERTEQEAQEMANKILKALGPRAATRVDALARALEIFDARLPVLLREFWGDGNEEQEEDE